ncbi:S1 family peptidase [Halalkalibacter krulwichiae]|uniref:Putative serine protease HhoB n=1 Tax=Halalkalibacter krulwichiae TaxID=199441 RepID=A0A1X9MBB8_9BACI|nr:serine protease [Halalkalibacter krulwichiae]ARK30716.1 Putative serine protease HhoB precursor [Halalkalibacter krulwichiae]
MKDQPEDNKEEEYVPTPEDFLFDEEESEEDFKKKKSKKRLFRLIGICLVLLLLLQVANIWFNLYSSDNRELVRTSDELSQLENINEFKEAVVTIQGNGGRGTGFNIHPEGLILTNHHVIDSRDPIAAIFPNGEILHAEVMKSDVDLDVALLRVQSEEDLPYLRFQIEDAKQSEKIYVIGNPLTQTQIINEGEILNNEFPFQVLKISNAIFPGHSGSPVLSQKGEVVGVVYARTIPSLRSGEESEGLAIPIERVLEVFPELKEIHVP